MCGFKINGQQPPKSNYTKDETSNKKKNKTWISTNKSHQLGLKISGFQYMFANSIIAISKKLNDVCERDFGKQEEW